MKAKDDEVLLKAVKAESQRMDALDAQRWFVGPHYKLQFGDAFHN